MAVEFINNGFIVKSYEERPYTETDKRYFGIGRYVTWPLDRLNDAESKRLSAEAMERWFGYEGCVMHASPDVDYISRYTAHCKRVGLPVFCLRIESACPNWEAKSDLLTERVLGYDYGSCNLAESCLHDDLGSVDPSIRDEFTRIRTHLNPFGLADSPDLISEYLSIRNCLPDSDYTLDEEYYYPTTVRLSKVRI